MFVCLFKDISDDLLDRKIIYCQELLDFVDVVDPEYSNIRGEILNELQSSIVVQTKRQYNNDKITNFFVFFVYQGQHKIPMSWSVTHSPAAEEEEEPLHFLVLTKSRTSFLLK